MEWIDLAQDRLLKMFVSYVITTFLYIYNVYKHEFGLDECLNKVLLSYWRQGRFIEGFKK